MFIPTWLLIAIGIVVAWLLIRRTRVQPSLSIHQMWELGTEAKNEVLAHADDLDDDLQDERDMVTAMELDAMRLRERFNHNTLKQSEIARDWMDYALAMKEARDSYEAYCASSADDAFKRYQENVKEPNIQIREIGQRIVGMLGDESHLGAVMTRIDQEAELAHAVRMKRRASR